MQDHKARIARARLAHYAPRMGHGREMIHHARKLRFANLSDHGPLDGLIVGGGLTGAPLYHQLCERGYTRQIRGHYDPLLAM